MPTIPWVGDRIETRRSVRRLLLPGPSRAPGARDDPQRLVDVIEIAPRHDQYFRLRAAQIGSEEIHDVHGATLRNPGRGVDADVHLAAFDLADVFVGISDELRQIFLTQPAQEPQAPDIPAHPDPDGAHVVSHDARNYWAHARSAPPYICPIYSS
jgi:hypothetical protein